MDASKDIDVLSVHTSPSEDELFKQGMTQSQQNMYMISSINKIMFGGVKDEIQKLKSE